MLLIQKVKYQRCKISKKAIVYYYKPDTTKVYLTYLPKTHLFLTKNINKKKTNKEER